MVYLGGKAKIAKYIVPFLQDIIDREGIKTYIEPCCGGCNIIDKIKCENRIASDISEPLISMWKALQRGWYPPLYLLESKYIDIKNNQLNYPQYLVGLVGYLGSFGTKWFGGYGRSRGRDCYNERVRNLLKQIVKYGISNIRFIHSDYRDLTIPQGSLVYVDIPYKDTSKYKDDFDHDVFYTWCKEIVGITGVKVIISEYSMPDEFKVVLEIPHFTNFSKQRLNKLNRTEKLFTI